MFIEVGRSVKAVCNDGTTYTGKLYALVIQLCEDDKNRPHALAFISQDKRFIDTEGDFGQASVWVDKLKSLEVMS